MEMPKTLVVPLDQSELAQRAASVATALAGRIGAGVLLVTAASDHETANARQYLDAVAALAIDVPVETLVVEDRAPAEAIVYAGEAAPDRMICMTTHGRGRFRWAVAGSVAEEVIRHASRPLLLVGPHAVATWSDPPGQVVLCTDGGPVAQSAIDVACAWTERRGAELTVVHVAHPLDVEGAQQPDAVFTPIEKIAHDRGVTVHTRFERSSYVAGALLDVADEPPAELLVMASHGRTGLARVALGSVTMAVLNSARCPVLVTPAHAAGEQA